MLVAGAGTENWEHMVDNTVMPHPTNLALPGGGGPLTSGYCCVFTNGQAGQARSG